MSNDRAQPNVEVSVDPRGFLKIAHLTSAVDVADFEEILAQHRGLASSRKVPVLVDARRARSMSLAARKAAAGPEVAALTSRLAIVVDGPVSTIIGNFFIRVSHPLVRPSFSRIGSQPRSGSQAGAP